MRFSVLGALDIRDDDGKLVRITAPKQQALLAFLLMQNGAAVSSDAIANALWAGEPPPSADTAVRFHVSKLRSLIERDGNPEMLRTAPRGYRLVIDGHEFDVHRFERLGAEGRALLDSQPDRAHRHFAEALGLWHGRAYQTVEGEPFVAPEITRLEALRSQTNQDRIEAELRLGRSAPLNHELADLVAANPLDERLVSMLMRSLYASGRSAEALEAANEARSRLGEVGLEPGPQITEFEDRILLHDSLLPTQESRAHDAGGLPVPLTRFIGRGDDIAAVADIVRRHRLATVTGSPGCGKTRLALEVATGLAGEFESGAHLVELSEISDPDLVMRTVGGAFGVAEIWGADYLSLLVDRLRNSSVLIMIDNAEHVHEAVAKLARGMLERCPRVHLLVTSRRPLGVPGEASWQLQPLAVPGGGTSLEEAIEFESIQLFVERAAVAAGRFELGEDNHAAVVQICRHVDGLPLAIELAAAGTAGLSVSELAKRLKSSKSTLPTPPRTATPRQRTMEAAVRWSIDLLEPRERLVFERLAVFSGGMTMGAAEHVAGYGDLSADDVFDIVLQLVHGSLLVPELESDAQTRYRMLTVVRQSAIDAAHDDDQWDDASARHADFFASVAEAIGPHMEGKDAELWRRRGDLELDNFRGALEWSLTDGDTSAALRLAPSLTWYWYWRSHLREGQRWAARTIETTSGSSMPGRMRTLYGSGLFNDVIGNLADAEEAFSEALSLASEAGNDELEARALTGLGVVARDRGELPTALDHFNRALQLDEGHQRMNRAISLRMGGLTRALVGDFPTGRAEIVRSQELYGLLGNDGGVAWSLAFLAYIDALAGDSDALDCAQTAVERFIGAGDTRGLGWGLLVAASCHALDGDDRAVATRAIEAQQRLTEVGDRRGLGYANLIRGTALLALGDTAGGEDALWSAHEFLRSLPDQVGLCRLATAQAILADVHGDRDRRRERLATAMRLADSATYPWGFVDVLSVAPAGEFGLTIAADELRQQLVDGVAESTIGHIRLLTR